MIDIYANALRGQQAATNDAVQSAAYAVRGGGSYQPFAPGTKTLGTKQLDETIRSNDMDDAYRNKALQETVRGNTLDNQYKMAVLAETIRNNDLGNTYNNRSLDAQIASANRQNASQENYQNMVSQAMGGVTYALSQGLTPAQVKKNVLEQSQQLMAGGINPQSVLDYVDSVYEQNLATEKERLDARPFYQKAVDTIRPGAQYR